MTYKGVDINFYRTILDNSLFVTSMSDVKKPTWIELFFFGTETIIGLSSYLVTL